MKRNNKKNNKQQNINAFAIDLVGIVYLADCKRPIYPISRQGKIMIIRQFVRNHLTKTKHINYTIGSYGVKHLIENHLGFSVSNGELIIAMLHEGYTVQPLQYGSLNARFNVYIPKNLI
jgi:hypothetical protein